MNRITSWKRSISLLALLPLLPAVLAAQKSTYVPSTGAANAAIKPAASDAIQYVSSNGNDLNDGLSWGTAKATMGAACVALGGNSTCSTGGAGTIFVSPGYSSISFNAFSSTIAVVWLGGNVADNVLNGLVFTPAQYATALWMFAGHGGSSLSIALETDANGYPSLVTNNTTISLDPDSNVNGQMLFAGSTMSAQNSSGTNVPVASSSGFRLVPTAFSSAPACSSANEGTTWAITDSTTSTWGATITGSGSNHVLGYCDGTNWTVAAK